MKITKLVITLLALTWTFQVYAATPGSGNSRIHDAADVPSTLTAEQFKQVLPDYLKIQKALAIDKYRDAIKAAASMVSIIQEFPDKTPPEFLRSGQALARSMDIKSARVAFSAISGILIESAKSLKPAADQGLYQVYCPMALANQGAYWIQDSDKVANPYFGSEMSDCGSIQPLRPEK